MADLDGEGVGRRCVFGNHHNSLSQKRGTSLPSGDPRLHLELGGVQDSQDVSGPNVAVI